MFDHFTMKNMISSVKNNPEGRNPKPRPIVQSPRKRERVLRRAPSPALRTAVRGIEIGCRRRFGDSLLSSWPAPEPAIHVAPRHGTTWIRGSSPRMTTSKDAQASPETRSRGDNTFPGQPCRKREEGVGPAAII